MPQPQRPVRLTAPPPLGWQLNRLGIRHEALAAAVGCSPAMVASLATGRRRGSAKLRARIAAAVGLPERELFDPDATITVTPAGRAAS